MKSLLNDKPSRLSRNDLAFTKLQISYHRQWWTSKRSLFLKNAVLTTRTETEWLELVDSGNNVLVGYDTKKILSEFYSLRKFKSLGKIYGDGNTSELILKALIEASHIST